MITYKARCSFYAATNRHFNQHETISSEVYFSLSSPDKLKFEPVGNPDPAVAPGLESGAASKFPEIQNIDDEANKVLSGLTERREQLFASPGSVPIATITGTIVWIHEQLAFWYRLLETRQASFLQTS